ncbi:Uncharacterised protein [Mycobacteroides abscessus subsp. abscessus]|nr:Uncharacterised protein [Mycobacteroides abscessus subsp. abscessus]
MHLVHPANAGASLGACDAVFEDGVEDQAGVVVAFLRSAGELVGSEQQAADGRHGVGAKQREAERLVDVPGKFLCRENAIDLLVLRVGIEVIGAVTQFVALHLVFSIGRRHDAGCVTGNTR